MLQIGQSMVLLLISIIMFKKIRPQSQKYPFEVVDFTKKAIGIFSLWDISEILLP